MTNPSPENTRAAPAPTRPAAATAAPRIAREPALTSRHFSAMRLVLDERRITARQAAAALDLSRATAGGALRALERAGMLDGELVGGGELGYMATAEGRAWVEDVASRGAARRRR
jgi:DNA-binding transcriptional ArsR family regulator